MTQSSIFIVSFFALLVCFLIYQINRLKKRLDIFLSSGDKNLEDVLKDLIQSSSASQKDIEMISKKVERLEGIAEISIQKIGLVRYSPLKGIGGDQSFSLALLNKEHSGFIITSLYLKKESRIFAKPIKNGKSEYSLSEEEKQAIGRAVD